LRFITTSSTFFPNGINHSLFNLHAWAGGPLMEINVGSLPPRVPSTATLEAYKTTVTSMILLTLVLALRKRI
jgi:hypothetical protein